MSDEPTAVPEWARERDLLLECLSDVLNQACRLSDGTIDSSALSAYAFGLRLLARHGRFVIEHEYGRRVIGHWADESASGERR